LFREWAVPKPVSGLTKNIGSYNPFRIAFHEWIDMWNDVRMAPTWRLKMKYVFGRPGWKEENKAAGVSKEQCLTNNA
jgi:hypothetical protein